MNAAALAWSAGATLASPALRLMLRRRAARGKEIGERLPERYGIDLTPRPSGRLIWVHAASVGETVSALPVIAQLARNAAVLVTTGTVTSAALLSNRLERQEMNGRVFHRFVPLDVPGWVARFLDHWRPDAGALIESELWPNLLFACQRRRMPLALLNARMSDRSFRVWSYAPGIAGRVLACFAVVQAQSEADADRLRRLGAPSVSAPGNLKFAAPPLPCNDDALTAARAALGRSPCWVAASTHPGEEELVAAAHRELVGAHPELVTIIVPRHPERGGELAGLGARRSMNESPRPGGIWIADTLGEMGLWYRLARIVLMGRSLIPPGGGQNPLEPARLGCAVACGRLVGNFAEPVQVLQQAGALEILPDVPAVVRWVDGMIRNPPEREAVGHRAAQAVRTGDALPHIAAQAVMDLIR
jgi:3-deoxy-D-manno-octulosonic-acid transferase